jgi:hypothetical protein
MTPLHTTTKAIANHSKKTFTLRTYVKGFTSSVYRTFTMSKDEFNSCLYNTERDWREFLNRSNDYYLVKK